MKKPSNIIDGSYLAVMFWMGADWVVRVYPLGGTQTIRMANEREKQELPRVVAKTYANDV
jgi:hypothetical protein